MAVTAKQFNNLNTGRETMPSTADYQHLISADVHLLGNILGEIIEQQTGSEKFALEERVRTLAKARRANGNGNTETELAALVDSLTLSEKEMVARSFTTYFELINLVEEHHRVRILRDISRLAARGASDRFRRLWRYYLAYCEGGFREGVLGDIQGVLAGDRAAVPSWIERPEPLP